MSTATTTTKAINTTTTNTLNKRVHDNKPQKQQWDAQCSSEETKQAEAMEYVTREQEVSDSQKNDLPHVSKGRDI